MAKFELSIYDANDEVIKKYQTNRVRWGILLKAVDLSGKINQKSPEEQLKAVGEILKLIFPDLTDEHLALADYNDVMNTFKQLINSIRTINIDDSKNV